MTRYTLKARSNNITPDQADYRGHVLLDRSTGEKKVKLVRRIRPSGITTLFATNTIHQNRIR